MFELTQASLLQCFTVNDEQTVAQEIATQYGEGEAMRRELPIGDLVLYRNVKDDTWTIIFFPGAGGQACPAGGGTGEPPAIMGQDI